MWYIKAIHTLLCASFKRGSLNVVESLMQNKITYYDNYTSEEPWKKKKYCPVMILTLKNTTVLWCSQTTAQPEIHIIYLKYFTSLSLHPSSKIILKRKKKLVVLSQVTL